MDLLLAERKGLEPSASGVTGRRYNRLNYRSVLRGLYCTLKRMSTGNCIYQNRDQNKREIEYIS